MIQATIPGVPESVNQRYGRRHDGGLYVPRETSGWQADVILLLGPMVSQNLRESWRAAIDRGATVRATMTWYRPDRRRRDTSNAIKALEDALSGVLGIDDRWFEWTTHRAYDKTNPRVDLVVELEGGET